MNTYGSLTRIVARASGAPCLATVSSPRFPEGMRSRRFASRCRRLIAVSPAVLRALDDNGVKTAAATVVAPVRLSLSDVPNVRRAERRLPRPLRLGWIGRFDPVKRLGDAIDVTLELCQRGRDVRLNAVAADVSYATESAEEHAAAIEHKLASLGAHDAVALLGARDDVFSYLADCDVFLTTSMSETLSMTTFEAMLAARPVVVTDAGALPDLVEHEHTGLVAPVADVGAMADAVERLVDDDALRARLADAGRRRAIELLADDPPIDALMRIYREVV